MHRNKSNSSQKILQSLGPSPIFDKDVDSKKILKSGGPTWLIRNGRKEPDCLTIDYLDKNGIIQSVRCGYDNKKGWKIGEEGYYGWKKIDKTNFNQHAESFFVAVKERLNLDLSSMTKTTFNKQKKYNFESFSKLPGLLQRSQFIDEYFKLNDSGKNKVLEKQSVTDVAKMIDYLYSSIVNNMQENKDYKSELKRLSEHFVNQCSKTHYKNLPRELKQAYVKAFFELDEKKTNKLLDNKEDRKEFLRDADALRGAMPKEREKRCSDFVNFETIKEQNFISLEGKPHLQQKFLASLVSLNETNQNKILQSQKKEDLIAMQKALITRGITTAKELPKPLQQILFKVSDMLETKPEKNIVQRLLRR